MRRLLKMTAAIAVFAATGVEARADLLPFPHPPRRPVRCDIRANIVENAWLGPTKEGLAVMATTQDQNLSIVHLTFAGVVTLKDGRTAEVYDFIGCEASFSPTPGPRLATTTLQTDHGVRWIQVRADKNAIVLDRHAAPR